MTYFRENIEKAVGYTPGFQPKEADVIKLNTNENSYPPSPKALEAIKGVKPEKLRKYPDPPRRRIQKKRSRPPEPLPGLYNVL